MSGINGLGSNTPYIPGLGDSDEKNVNGLNGTQGARSVGGVNSQPVDGNVRAPLSLGANATGVHYSQPSPLEPRNLILPGSITDSTNVDITSCLVLLLKTAVEMRKDQREQWITQAQNTLATSNVVAELQKEAALSKFIGESVTTGASALVSIGQAAASIAECRDMKSSSNAIDEQANAHFGTDDEIEAKGKSKANADDDVDVDAQAKSIIGKEGLTSNSIGGDALTEGTDGVKNSTKALKDAQKVEAKQVQNDLEAPTTDVPSTAKKTTEIEAKTDFDIRQQKKEKAQFTANANAAHSASIQAKYQVINNFLGAVNTGVKIVGSGTTYQSETLSAVASEQKALADFQATAASDQLDFANELRDYASSILSTIRDVESARHAASNAIANI
jgi:hypothetical protein